MFPSKGEGIRVSNGYNFYGKGKLGLGLVGWERQISSLMALQIPKKANE